MEKLYPLRWLVDFAAGFLLLLAVARVGHAGFDDPASWSTYDPGANGVGTAAEGFRGGVFDGRYIYFVPALGGEPEILRYDTAAPFAAASSWQAFDPASGTDSVPDALRKPAAWALMYSGSVIQLAEDVPPNLFHAAVQAADTDFDPSDLNSYDSGWGHRIQIPEPVADAATFDALMTALDGDEGPEMQSALLELSEVLPGSRKDQSVVLKKANSLLSSVSPVIRTRALQTLINWNDGGVDPAGT